MKFKKSSDITEFQKALAKCVGGVWLTSPNGDKLDLRSVFSQYIAFGRLIEDRGEDLTLTCEEACDKAILFQFLCDHE